MKRLFQIVGFFFALGIFYLFTQSHNVHEITSEVTINAPKDKVWAVISNIDGWADNNSAINASKGELPLPSDNLTVLHRKISITMRSESPGEDGPTYEPEIINLDVGMSFRWRAKMGAEIIFTNDKLLKLQEVDGGTKLTHTEYFSGMMVPLMLSWFDTGVPPILDEMNAGFKAAAEK